MPHLWSIGGRYNEYQDRTGLDGTGADLNSGLDLIYENMKSWQDRFPNLRCISLFLFENEMRVRIDWQDDTHYVYVVSQIFLDTHTNLDAFGNMILSEAERQYRVHDVGEE